MDCQFKKGGTRLVCAPCRMPLSQEDLAKSAIFGYKLSIRFAMAASVVLICICILLSGCSKDADPQGGDRSASTTLVLFINETESHLRASSVEEEGLPGESKINSLLVMEFDSGGALETTKKISLLDDITSVTDHGSPIRMDIKPGINKTVVVIANGDDNLINTVSTLEELKKLSFREKGDGSGIIMAGEVKHDARLGVNAYVHVPLTRLSAKVSLYIGKDEQIRNKEIKITAINLINLNKSTTLFESETRPQRIAPNDRQSKAFGNISESTPIEVTGIINGTSKAYTAMGEIYTLEQLLDPNTPAEGNAPELEVHATCDGVPTMYHATILTDDHYLRRNTHYVIHATIKDMGDLQTLLITTKVMPWNYMEYKEFYEDLVFVRDEDNHDFAMGDGAEHETTYDNPLKLKVCIKGYPGSKWKATMDNGYDFEFEGQSWGIANGKDEVTICIKPRNKNIRERKETKIYFTVNGYEVPGATFKVFQNPPATPQEED